MSNSNNPVAATSSWSALNLSNKLLSLLENVFNLQSSFGNLYHFWYLILVICCRCSETFVDLSNQCRSRGSSLSNSEQRPLLLSFIAWSVALRKSCLLFVDLPINDQGKRAFLQKWCFRRLSRDLFRLISFQEDQVQADKASCVISYQVNLPLFMMLISLSSLVTEFFLLHRQTDVLSHQFSFIDWCHCRLPASPCPAVVDTCPINFHLLY